MCMKRVVVVDQDQATAELIAEFLKSEGFAPLGYPEWPASLASIDDAQADLLILELGPGDPNSTLHLLGALRRRPGTQALPVIVNSTDDRLLEDLAGELHDLGCAALAKPFDLNQFLALIGMCLDITRDRPKTLALSVGGWAEREL